MSWYRLSPLYNIGFETKTSIPAVVHLAHLYTSTSSVRHEKSVNRDYGGTGPSPIFFATTLPVFDDNPRNSTEIGEVHRVLAWHEKKRTPYKWPYFASFRILISPMGEHHTRKKQNPPKWSKHQPSLEWPLTSIKQTGSHFGITHMNVSDLMFPWISITISEFFVENEIRPTKYNRIY